MQVHKVFLNFRFWRDAPMNINFLENDLPVPALSQYLDKKVYLQV